MAEIRSRPRMRWLCLRRVVQQMVEIVDVRVIQMQAAPERFSERMVKRCVDVAVACIMHDVATVKCSLSVSLGAFPFTVVWCGG